MTQHTRSLGEGKSLLCLTLLVLLQVSMLQSEEFQESLEESTTTPPPPPLSHGRAREGAWEARGEKRNWHAAALACARAGGSLAVPRSRDEAVAVGRLMLRADPHAPMAFVGFNDLAHDGDFATEDGKPMVSVGYARFHSWNFRYGDDDHCVAVDHFGLYWDLPCNWALPFVCHLPPPPPPPPTCPTTREGMLEDTEEPTQDIGVGSYSLESAVRNWWAARGACARSGRRLALPSSGLEREALRDLLIASTPPGADDDPKWALAFVGGSDLARAGRPRTLLGEPFSERIEVSEHNEENGDHENEELTTTPATTEFEVVQDGDAEQNGGWEQNGGLEPNGEMEQDGEDDPPEVQGGSSCVAVNRLGEFAMARCNTSLPFFCEDPAPLPAPAPCPTPANTDPDLVPPPPGHLWLQHTAPLPWEEAARACLEDGGVLAVPETTAEAKAMADLLRSVPHPSDEDIGLDVWAYIGAMNTQDPTEEYTTPNFTTVFGTPLRWARWGVGQPNGDPGRQPCLVLDRAGTLWDLPCYPALGYFCRRFPADPPWMLPATRNAHGGGWRVHSQEMRRWLRTMDDLGAGVAVAHPPEDDGEGDNDVGDTQAEVPAAEVPSSARGFAHVDLRAWIESFRENSSFHFAPFVFDA